MDFGAGCVQLWICPAEPPGERCYANWNKNILGHIFSYRNEPDAVLKGLLHCFSTFSRNFPN